MTQKSLDIVAAEVHHLIKQRGYLDGYTTEELIGRNVIKAVEELCEVCEHVRLDPDERIEPFIYTLGRMARTRFDSNRWKDCGPKDIELLKSELADATIPLLLLKTLIEIVEQQQFDLAALCIDKAHNDVARGIRK
jgi:hypothetical protein